MLAIKVLVVEDERIVALELRRRLENLGYIVATPVGSGRQALEQIIKDRPDLVLMDIHLDGDMDGIETARCIIDSYKIPVVFLTAYSEEATVARARTTRPYGFLLKPFTERELHATIQMAIERYRADMALIASETRLRLAIDAAQLSIWELNPQDGNIVWYEAGGQATGADLPTPSISHLQEFLSLVHADDRDQVATTIQQLSADSSKPYKTEFRSHHVSGKPRWLKLYGQTFPGSGIAAQRTVGITQDITERKVNEEKIKAANASLKMANEEMEAFCYAVSHDLRAPLRAIQGFSLALHEDYEDHLDSAGREYLALVRAGAQKMGRLIDDLLKLAYMTHAEMRFSTVDLSDMVRKCLDSLAADEPSRKVAVIVRDGIFVQGDPGLLQAALENMLGNAWKFTAKRDDATIEFGMERQAGKDVYFVRDNGAGFDMQNYGRLFNAFQRLHSGADYPGTGVGMATVKRIVTRHGGEIWARAEVNEGATFYFTLGTSVGAA